MKNKQLQKNCAALAWFFVNCGIGGNAALFAQAYTDTIPAWLLPLREAVYEQVLDSAEAVPLYEAAKRNAEAAANDIERLTLLSKCEYLMGRIYQFEKKKNEAAACYERGAALAGQALSIRESAEGWELRASNISQLCLLKPISWVMAHGLDVEKFSKNALALDAANAPALYMLASRWVYAPWPLCDPVRGIAMLENMLDGGAALQKDDLFNVYSGLVYGYLRDKKTERAKAYLEKTLDLYPTNRFAGETLKAQVEKGKWEQPDY